MLSQKVFKIVINYYICFTWLLHLQFRINAHKDNAISNNKKRLESGKSAKRPGLISMEYTALNSSMQLMSPYGGTIYVFLESDASFDMTINGAIEMPYFIQGTKFKKKLNFPCYQCLKIIYRRNN